ncbi:suppressor of fused domain protein [Euzebya tangerina]|uniref:suppressor of fused domain protein n=1 Tax=Euzebya tangerina TaxID=591198 RepID=UPI000E30BEF8|nr:suppressor of fused domain protein [Euzebya tangerina]
MTLVDHLEEFLGPITKGWHHTRDGTKLPFGVAMHEPGKIVDTAIFSTLGLSEFPLPSDMDRPIRHEFIMMVPDVFRPGPIPGFLQQAGMEVLSRDQPLLRGDTLGPYGDLFKDGISLMQAMYAAIPVYLPDEFAAYGDVALVWLLLVTRVEYEAIRQQGWEHFEDRLMEAQADMIDVWRWPVFDDPEHPRDS